MLGVAWRSFKSAVLILTVVISFFSILTVFFFSGNYAHGMTYQDTSTVRFTMEPSLSLSLSSTTLSIGSLTPGSYNDSNNITVSVTTNASGGYRLSATAGTKTSNTNLTNGSYKFTSLSSNKASLSAFSNNYWGYSYSINNGTSWISGSQGNTSSGYNGLPLDNNDQGSTGVTLINTTAPADSKSIKFKIGAKASTDQPYGTYTGQINFYAVAN